MTKRLEILGKVISESERPFVIAEISGNHNGDIERAYAIIDAAAEAGADAVKLQTYTPDTMTLDCDRPDFQIKGGLWDGYSLFDLYEWAHTPWDWHERLFERGRELGVPVFSTPFDSSSIAFLESLNTPAYKIASFELVDLPFVRKVAQTGKPVILSTGMANISEIEEAISAAKSVGNENLIVMHCVSGYPAPARDYNLATIPDLADRLGLLIGLSDHTLGITVPIAAVAKGAVIIEKHLTLRREDGGPDSAFSLEPDEFKLMVDGVHVAWQALGKPDYHRKKSETDNVIFRRSLYVVKDIPNGEKLNENNIRSIRPGHGIAPKHLPDVLGRVARRTLIRGEALSWDMLRSK